MANLTALNQSVVQFGIISGEQLEKRDAIGQGSFGTVYKAEHVDWGPVAFKRLSQNEFIEQCCVDDLVKEVRAHYHLRHPNIVQMMAVVHTPEVELGLVMWLEKYGNAHSFTREYDVPIAWKIKMIREVTLGLNYLHKLSTPVIHGDIKLRNVLVGEGFVAKISDFGLSVWKEYTSIKSSRGHMLTGTISHMAPELLNDITHRINERTDVYSLAIFMWEFIVQRNPYPGRNVPLMIDAVKHGQRPSLSDMPVEAPEECSDLIRSCWSQEDSQRPSCKEILMDIEMMMAKLTRHIEVARKKLQEKERVKCAEAQSTLYDPSTTGSFPGVDHHPIGSADKTNPTGPQQIWSSGDVCAAVQCIDGAKGHSSGYAFRYGGNHFHDSEIAPTSSCGSAAANANHEDTANVEESCVNIEVPELAGCDHGSDIEMSLHSELGSMTPAYASGLPVQYRPLISSTSSTETLTMETCMLSLASSTNNRSVVVSDPTPAVNNSLQNSATAVQEVVGSSLETMPKHDLTHD